MAIVLMLDLPQSQASNQAAARADAANIPQTQAQARADLMQARAEMIRAQAEARVAQQEARIAQAEAAQARQGTIVVNPRWSRGPSNREQGMLFIGFLVLTLVAVVILHPIARALGRRLEGGPRRDAKLDIDSSAQLQRIEHTVEAMAIEIERLSEGQRFTTKLLAGRADAESPIPRS